MVLVAGKNVVSAATIDYPAGLVNKHSLALGRKVSRCSILLMICSRLVRRGSGG